MGKPWAKACRRPRLATRQNSVTRFGRLVASAGARNFLPATPTPWRTARFSQRKDVITFSGRIIFSTDFDIRLSTRSKK